MIPADDIKELPDGTRITMTVEGYFGQPLQIEETTMGEVRHHGYYEERGGWGLYPVNLPGYKNIECWEVLVRQKRKRHSGWVKIGYRLQGYKLGWDDEK
ncbi:hypothetical protein MHH52_11170 [Paenibacillus sp. FSL K6-0276]|uniref:hypothetical protein n=1 Tax=Paenibacillus sp. FSL K6-0276 TaxID=2921450 RepID=UPI0030EB79F2